MVVALACALGLTRLTGSEPPLAPVAPVARETATRPHAAPVTPQPTAPPPLAATAARSDAFDAWGEGPGQARFLATDDSHSGSFALRVVRGSTGQSGHLDQVVPVTKDAPLHVTLFARSQGSAPNPVLLRLDTGTVATLALPGGDYDWRSFTLTTTVPPSVATARVSLISAAPTGLFEIDDVAVRATGSSQPPVQDPGFETNSADLEITNSSLLLSVGRASLDIVTRRAPEGDVRWTADDGTGRMAARGTAVMRDGRGAVSLDALPEGTYTVTLRARFGTRSVLRTTPVVVLAPHPTDGRRTFGVGIHGGSPDAIRSLLTELARLGVTAARTDVTWGSVERSPGRFTFPPELDAAVAAMGADGIRPLLIPGYANALYDEGRTPSSKAGIAAYARFAAAVARHYPGADIDVYNEFDFRNNTSRCGRGPDCYLPLLAAAATAVRAAHTGAAVVAPSITGNGIDTDWLDPFLTHGGGRLVDALGLHPYTQPAAPDGLAAELDRLRAEARARTGRALPIWFTEVGWSTVPGWVTERAQAEDLMRTMAVALDHGVDRVYWYDAVDDARLPLDLESNFGLFALPSSFAPNALKPKAAAGAEAAATRWLTGCAPDGADAGLPAGVTSYRFRCGSEERRVAWNDGPARAVVAGPWRATTATGSDLRDLAASPLVLTASPVLLRGPVQVRAGG
jgi:polysaccharide biosynthesis protein PslG